jgi:hypothetical protein
MGRRSRAFGSTGAQFRAAALFVSVLLLSAVGSAIDLTSFRTPYSRVTTSDISFYSGSSLLSSTVLDTPYSRSDLWIGPYWHWFTQTQSDPRNWFLDERFDLFWDGSQELWHSERQTNRELRADEEVNLNWQEYLGRSDFLVSLTPDVMLTPSARFDSGRTVIGVGCIGTGGLSIGYGRFRDAWPLAKAIRLVGILRDCNLLEEEPKEGPLLKLADFIANSWRLFYAHDRAAKFYYDSLEVILLEDRILREPLPAYALMKLDDELTVGFDQREFGSQLLLGAFGSLVDYFHCIPAHGQTGASFQNHLVKPDSPHPHAEYRYARPIGLRWVTGADLYYELVPERRALTHTLNCALAGSYQVSNRLLVDISLRLYGNGRYALDTLASPVVGEYSSLIGGFHYYLADRLVFSASAGVSDAHQLVGEGGHEPRTEVFFGFGIGAGPQWFGEPTPVFEP